MDFLSLNKNRFWNFYNTDFLPNVYTNLINLVDWKIEETTLSASANSI